MRSGKLRTPIKVVREITSQTSTGGEKVEYEDVLTSRAEIKSVNGREYIEGGAELMETTVKIIMRIHPSQKRIFAGDIVRGEGREYSIISPLIFDNNTAYQLMCKEII